MSVVFSLGLGARQVIGTLAGAWLLASGAWDDGLPWADSEEWID